MTLNTIFRLTKTYLSNLGLSLMGTMNNFHIIILKQLLNYARPWVQGEWAECCTTYITSWSLMVIGELPFMSAHGPVHPIWYHPYRAGGAIKSSGFLDSLSPSVALSHSFSPVVLVSILVLLQLSPLQLSCALFLPLCMLSFSCPFLTLQVLQFSRCNSGVGLGSKVFLWRCFLRWCWCFGFAECI
jgi:hypothetical protein